MILMNFMNKIKTLSASECAAITAREIIARGKTRTGKKRGYMNELGTFDIETTTVKNENTEKTSGIYSHFNYCYHWQFFTCENIYICGRHIEDFFEFEAELSALLPATFLIFIHNFKFEFNNLREFLIPDSKTFMRSTVLPLVSRRGNIEYRCSYQLTHKPLSKLAHEVGRFKPDNYDYTTPRHSGTPLTRAELEYCRSDVENLYLWLVRERAHYCESIKKPECTGFLPLTQTGYIRYDIKHVFSNTRDGRRILGRLKFTNESEFIFFHKAMTGGDTQAGKIGTTFKNVRHRDFTSAYPAKMFFEKFPMSKFFPCKNPLQKIRSGYAVIARYILENIEIKNGLAPPMRQSQTEYITADAVVVNGRILAASGAILVICEQDFLTFLEFYTFDLIAVDSAFSAKKDYLPHALRALIVKYFNAKTVYKDDPENVLEYALNKQKLNAAFGCAAMSLIQPAVEFEGLESVTKCGDFQNSKVMPYQWAIYITAYVRRDLNMFKRYLKDDFIYCDTDSIFYKENSEFEKFVNAYNQNIENRLRALRTEYPECIPLSHDGKPQYLGEFNAGKDYIIDRFTTAGAKRYAQTVKGVTDLTIAGVPATKHEKDGTPQAYLKYINEKYGGAHEVIRRLAKNEKIPLPYIEGAGKLANYVEVGDFSGYIDDGNTIEHVTAKSSQVLYSVDCDLSLEKSIANILQQAGEYKDRYYSE